MPKQLLILILLFLFVAAPGVRAAECANCCLGKSASVETPGCCTRKNTDTEKTDTNTNGHQEDCKRCFTQLAASNDHARASVEFIFSTPVLDVFFNGALLSFNLKNLNFVAFNACDTPPFIKKRTAILRC